MPIKYYFSLLFISLFLFSSCQDDEFEDLDLDDDSNPPTDGRAFGIREDVSLSQYENVASNATPFNTTEFPDFSSVVAFNYSLDGSDEADFVASGTLINSEWILTAAHNFFVADEQTSPAPVSGIDVLIGNNPNNPSQTLSVAELVFHPTWIAQSNDFLNANDLCLVRLASPITSITPAELNSSTSEVIGATTWFAGYGDYSRTAGQNPNLFSRKHAIQNILDRKVANITSGSGSSTFLGGLLAFDFDSPAGDINTLGDNIINPDESLLGTGTSDVAATDFEGATVEGDSGGPLFMTIDGSWKLCGVLSGGASEPIEDHAASDYGDISMFIRVSTAYDWIQSIVN